MPNKKTDDRIVAKMFETGPSATREADWSEADAGKLVAAISAAAVTGGALRFGYTRDGNAYAIGIYGDGEPYTLFVRPSEDIDGALDSIRAGFEDLRFRGGATDRKGKKG